MRLDRTGGRRAVGTARGFSLAELLAVMAILAIALGIGIPIVNEQLRLAEVRSAADELVLHLRAARQISVTKHKTIEFKVNVDPVSTFEYEGLNTPRKFVSMPPRVRISPVSDRSILFRKNGSVEAASSIVLEAEVSGAHERWTATISTVGLTTLTHERVP